MEVVVKKTGAQILLESIKLEGIDLIFGYPGGALLPIFDELYDAPIKFILTRHEQAAAHAANRKPAPPAESSSSHQHLPTHFR